MEDGRAGQSGDPRLIDDCSIKRAPARSVGLADKCT
jgi:hypothetical protein